MNKISVQFSLLFFISFLIGFLLLLFGSVNTGFIIPFIYAIGLNIINAALSVYSFQKGYKNSTKNFLLFIFGGMIIRMFLILLLFFIVIKYFNVDITIFVFTFFVLYFIALILEINYYRLQTLRK